MNVPQFGFGNRIGSISPDDVAATGRVFREVERLVCGYADHQQAPAPTEGDLIKLAKRVKAMRELRRQFFEECHFGEAAWDMLLALFIAQGEGYRLKVGDACNESGVAPTTALRWVDRLIETNLAIKKPHPTDSRVTFVDIHPDASRKMRDFLTQTWSCLISAR